MLFIRSISFLALAKEVVKDLAREPAAIMLGVLALTSVIFGILEVLR